MKDKILLFKNDTKMRLKQLYLYKIKSTYKKDNGV